MLFLNLLVLSATTAYFSTKFQKFAASDGCKKHFLLPTSKSVLKQSSASSVKHLPIVGTQDSVNAAALSLSTTFRILQISFVSFLSQLFSRLSPRLSSLYLNLMRHSWDKEISSPYVSSSNPPLLLPVLSLKLFQSHITVADTYHHHHYGRHDNVNTALLKLLLKSRISTHMIP